MKKEKKYLNELENKLNNISKKKRESIVNKYREKIQEEKSKNKKIVEILKELGTPSEVAEKELNNLKSNNKFKLIIDKVKNFIKKDIQFPSKDKNKKVKKEKVKKEKIKKDKSKIKINIFKKKKKDSIKDNIIEVKEEIQNELPNVIESVTETKIFESKKSKTKRIVLKSLGILFIMILLFIWLWLTVILMASMFAILDGIKFYGINITILGIDILLLLMIILVNKKILNKKINSKLTFISLIVLLIIIAFGITLSIKQISKVETVKDVSDKYTMTRKYEKINLSSNLEKTTYISFNANYDTKYIIEYDNTLDNKLTIETKYYESYYDYYMKQNSNDVYVSLSVDYRDRLSVYLENLKDKKIYDKNELSRYIVKITMNERDKDRVVIEN